VGPGAAVRIDAFVFNPDESVSRKVVSVGHGVFRYISGLTANQQDTKILTSNGALAVRGSVAAGIVDAEVPNFIYVGEGNAVFTNDSGSTDLRPGDAIAVPSRTTAVMRPEAMPPAIAAQALQAIERRLPRRDVLRHRPPPDEAWLKRVGGANLLPVAENCSGKPPGQAHERLWRRPAGPESRPSSSYWSRGTAATCLTAPRPNGRPSSRHSSRMRRGSSPPPRC
jgi:mannose-6-phosphate isomerase-like protein (cupin superfamily)